MLQRIWAWLQQRLGIGQAGRCGCSRGDRGAVMVMAAVWLTLCLLFTGLALDFGRAHLYKAMVQTAVDASALAGALEVVPMVEIAVPRWQSEEYTCWDSVRKKNQTCMRWVSAAPARLSGREDDLLVRGNWWSAIQDQCRWPMRCDHHYSIVRDWIILPPTAKEAAQAALNRNATWPAGSYGGRMEQVQVHTDPVRAEVTTTVTLSTPTLFLKLIGIDRLTFTRTGSARPVRR